MCSTKDYLLVDVMPKSDRPYWGKSIWEGGRGESLLLDRN